MVSQVQGDRRAGLGWYADRYFGLLPSGRHAELPTAPGVVFTENGQVLPLGKGLWGTATGAAATRAVTVADSESGQIATWGMVKEAGQDAILGLRLKVGDAGLIAEIETFVVRFNDMVSTFRGSGLLDAGRLARPTPGLLDLVDERERPSADELRRAADGYLDGVSGGDAGLIPAADDCLRIENGLQTVLNPDGAGFPEAFISGGGLGLGVRDQIRTRAFRYIEGIRDRRVVAADSDRGLVLVCCFFDHPGQLRDADFTSPIASPNSMMIWELFKVAGGLIRRIEAIGAAFPYGMRAGW